MSTATVLPSPAPPAGSRRPDPAPDTTCLRASLPVRLTPRHGMQAVTVQVDCLWVGARQGPTVIVQGGISAGRDVCASAGGAVSGWWQPLVGPGRAIDTRRVRVLAIDWLDAGALGVQAIGSEDQADALAGVLDALHLHRVEAYVGASYGAMVGLAFAARHGRRLGRLIAIAGAHRPHPLASAQRAVQRGILRLGLETGREQAAVSLARQLALTTYRGSGELLARFAGQAARVDGRWQVPVEAWLAHGGRTFAARCTAQRYLSLSESIDLHEVDPARIHVPVDLIGIASDRLVPLSDLCLLQQALPHGASLEVIDSACGHDAFLVEHARLGPLLSHALESAACSPASASLASGVRQPAPAREGAR